MSPREQLLQKRVAYLEARSNALMMVLDRAIDDIERAESVACALAWDFEASSWEWVGSTQFCTFEHSLPGMREAGK